MFKKILSFAVSAMMVLGLAACGQAASNGSSSPAKTATSAAVSKAAGTSAKAATTAAVSNKSAASTQAGSTAKAAKLVFAWRGNQVRNDRTQQVLDLYAKKNPGITFDSQPAQFSDYFTKLATAAAGNSLPDLIQMNYSSYLNQYVQDGLLEDLTPYTKNGALDISKIDKGILDSGSINGKLYAICSGVNAPALIYNKTLTDSLGITIKDNMTLEEFEAISKQIFEKSGVKTDLAYGNSSSMMAYIMRGEGINNLFGDKKFSVTDKKAFEPFFEIYEKGLKEGWMLNAATYAEITLNSVEQSPLVYYSSPETESWCACNWSNQLVSLQKSAKDGAKLAFSTWPAKDPKKANYLHPSMYFSISANSSHKEDSVKVLNYLINDMDCNNILLAERGIPAPSNVAEAIASKLPEESKEEVKFINSVVTPNSSTISPVEPKGAAEVFSLSDKLVEQVLYGKTTAADASAQFFKQGNDILAK
jgi:multiple sugar transport system substrate-binding protein